MDLRLVLALAHAVDDGPDHHEHADQDAGQHAGQEQVAGGHAGGQGVQHEGDGGRDDHAQAAGHGDHAGAPLPVIAQSHHEGDGHGAHGGGGGGTGAGDGAVEQAGHDDGTGNAAGEVTHEVGEEVEQSLGDAALGHDDAAQDEQGHRQDGGGVGTGEGVVDQLLNGTAGIRDQDGGQSAHDHTGRNGNRYGDANQENDKYQQCCHYSFPPFSPLAMAASSAAS